MENGETKRQAQISVDHASSTLFKKKHAVRVAESRAVKHQCCTTQKVVLRKNRHIGDSAKKL